MVVVLMKENGECHSIDALFLKIRTKCEMLLSGNVWAHRDENPTHIRVARA